MHSSSIPGQFHSVPCLQSWSFYIARFPNSGSRYPENAFWSFGFRYYYVCSAVSMLVSLPVCCCLSAVCRVLCDVCAFSVRVLSLFFRIMSQTGQVSVWDEYYPKKFNIAIHTLCVPPLPRAWCSSLAFFENWAKIKTNLISFTKNICPALPWSLVPVLDKYSS